MPKQYINPPEVGPNFGLYNHAVRAGNTLYIAGQAPLDAEGRVLGPGDIETQARLVFQNISRILKEAGASPSDVVELVIYTTSVLYRPAIVAAREAIGVTEAAGTFIVVQGLAVPELLVEVEGIAVLDTPKERINPPSVWSSKGTFSQAVRAGDTIYLAGQVARDKNRNLVGPGNIEKQVDATFENICRLLEAAGASASDVVKTVTYATNPLYRAAINEGRKRYGLTQTINTLGIIPSLAAPDLLLEVRSVAVVGTPKEVIPTPDVPVAGTYVRLIRTGKTFYIAGMVARAKDGSVAGIGNPEQQAVQVFENLRTILGPAGVSFDDIVATQMYYANILYRPAVNEARRRYGLTRSTNTSVVVSSLAMPELLCEVEGTAVVE